MPPKLMVCYICGREFSMSSLMIHEPQCLKVNNQMRSFCNIKILILIEISRNGRSKTLIYLRTSKDQRHKNQPSYQA